MNFTLSLSHSVVVEVFIFAVVVSVPFKLLDLGGRVGIEGHAAYPGAYKVADGARMLLAELAGVGARAGQKKSFAEDHEKELNPEEVPG